MGMLDRFKTDHAATEQEPRAALAAYMARDGYSTDYIDAYMARHPEPSPEPEEPVEQTDTLAPFRDVLAVCHERMRHFGGGVGQTYAQVASMIETAIAQVEDGDRG